VTVTGVALDPVSGNVQGFYINDSGNGKSAEFVSTVIMRVAWQDTGGWCIVTDAAHPDLAGPPRAQLSERMSLSSSSTTCIAASSAPAAPPSIPTSRATRSGSSSA
jgi:hypothetical protein